MLSKLKMPAAKGKDPAFDAEALLMELDSEEGGPEGMEDPLASSEDMQADEEGLASDAADLSAITDEELEAELKRRRMGKAKPKAPAGFPKASKPSEDSEY